jgi:redox-sensitive bicupin YhaK (pirin superfamily)
VSIKPGISIRRPTPTIEGAGVRLERAFGFDDSGLFDPFLLFDDFRSENPEHYRAGFPWHPHRGIETITYVLAGSVDHGDSLGNQGTLRSGDVQWMTAGSGILHQEMPRGDGDGRMHGFQLWLNLPAVDKMTAPRYQDISSADVPEVTDDDGTNIRIVCGEFWGRRGPVDHIAANPRYLDVSVPPRVRRCIPVDRTHHQFAYVFAGAGAFRDASEPQPILTEYATEPTSEPVYQASNRTLVMFDPCDEVTVEAGEPGVRFLLVSGRPFGEPVAWRGPIVMNTPEELREAYAQLRDGTFIAAT